jgi:hypothetical protein
MSNDLLLGGDRTKPLYFFDALYEAYKKAEFKAGGGFDRFYSIGGFSIKLQFAGSALIPYITPALSHLATTPTDEPSLTVCLWDSSSTNTLILTLESEIYDYLKSVKVSEAVDDRIAIIFEAPSKGLNVLDRSRNLAIYWIKNPEKIAYYESAAPLRFILHLWMRKQGIQLVHAGAVGLPSGGVLLVGKGGAGKSTTALACIHSELFYASDDYTLIKAHPSPTVFSIYSTGKQNADDVQRLSALNSTISNRDRLDTEKAVYFLHEHFPEKIISSFPLKAILIPKISGKTNTTWKIASATEALTGLLPSTIIQLPNTGKQACQIAIEVVKQVPSYVLEVGTDLVQIPEVILTLVAKSE